jgi:hypothetical protein
MILIGFKFHPGHQNAKYVCGDVNKKQKKRHPVLLTLLNLYQSHWLVSHASVFFFICLILELYINACSIRILKQCIPHLLSVLIVVYVFSSLAKSVLLTSHKNKRQHNITEGNIVYKITRREEECGIFDY